MHQEVDDGVRQEFMYRVTAALEDLTRTFRAWMHLPDLTPLYATLGTVAANYMAGDALWLMIVGPPGCGKTVIIGALNGLPDVHPISTLTESALLSGTPVKEKAKGTAGGLLREIGELGILTLKDFTSVLGMRRDKRGEVLAALREIHDGRWTRRIGEGGGRKLHWEGKLGLVTGCTNAIDSAHSVIATMGERFLQIRQGREDSEKAALFSIEQRGKEAAMRKHLSQTVVSLFDSIAEAEGFVPNPDLTDQDKRSLARLANVVTVCRSGVERNYSTLIENVPESEAPARVAKSLAQLYVGLRRIGLLHPRAWQVVCRVGLDSIPRIRRLVLDVLSSGNAQSPAVATPTARIVQAVSLPDSTVRRGLEDLEVHRAVQRKRRKRGESKSDCWFLSHRIGADYAEFSSQAMTFPEVSPTPKGEERAQTDITGKVRGRGHAE
jgi:energy-coupling factor transporter ATP-binding protein EcfA2